MVPSQHLINRYKTNMVFLLNNNLLITSVNKSTITDSVKSMAAEFSGFTVAFVWSLWLYPDGWRAPNTQITVTGVERVNDTLLTSAYHSQLFPPSLAPMWHYKQIWDLDALPVLSDPGSTYGNLYGKVSISDKMSEYTSKNSRWKTARWVTPDGRVNSRLWQYILTHWNA